MFSDANKEKKDAEKSDITGFGDSSGEADSEKRLTERRAARKKAQKNKTSKPKDAKSSDKKPYEEVSVKVMKEEMKKWENVVHQKDKEEKVQKR